MKKLLSLPPNLVDCFHDITSLDRREWFCTNDPIGKKLGSGGGTTWLLEQCYREWGKGQSFDQWLASDRRLILHAGGQSRRLPAYAPSGKILTPIPVFRWERGQRLAQDLLSLQLPLYEKIMQEAPQGLNTMIVSGDVYIRATQPLGRIPDADVVCYGLWLDSSIAKDHGVFVSSREEPSRMQCMLQKPSLQKLSEVLEKGYYLTDIGIWLLSDRAMKVLMRKSRGEDGEIRNYDMYSDFGCALGTAPSMPDTEVGELSVAILPLPGGEFYHYGTTHEIISSTLAVQNIVNDQREIMHNSRKPHPAMFIQNSHLDIKVTDGNKDLWIENSTIGGGWTISRQNVITGVPQNDWTLTLREGQCVDIVPVNDSDYVVRPYGFNDLFRGDITDGRTAFLGIPFTQWAESHGVDAAAFEGGQDMQSARIFPVLEDVGAMGRVLAWMLGDGGDEEARAIWQNARKMCADEISAVANLRRLTAQRDRMRADNMLELAENHQHSVFFQIDLDDAARSFVKYNTPLPEPLTDDNTLLKRIHDNMFRSEVLRLQGKDGEKEAANAFSLLRHGLTAPLLTIRQSPRLSVYMDQIIWGRSPVRIDIAGGWTDTPPYCLMEGGDVINLAIELNGQPPLQTFVKPSAEPVITLRSIDIGASERVTTYEQLADFNKVGSPFSIPKAALALAGFHPDFSAERFESLEKQLQAFGCGIELSMLSAIPAGSGLGTSSILASTVLGALNEFCGLTWDKNEIGRRTLVLEQLLTTGGGWQDQFGGLLQGIKLLHTERGFEQNPQVRWLPSDLYTQPEYAACHLLYYTGITRTAKTLLAEIVRRMFLNHHDEIAMLRQMKEHTRCLYETIQRGDFEGLGRAIRKTWIQNQAMDKGTNPDSVRAITDMVDDLCLGYKLPGAGGGGYLYMVAKDPDAAARIKQMLSASPQNANARFVDMTLSGKGLQISRS
ncbi:MAG: bifunctional fucokinase/fucose-1-phosphate guanylyltransferase [Prevotellaceae bacterium]|nr:bifunctional fucokinase/fucose-1-phosphate guanylyltransferase [Prevotellaceae bacterium]MDO4931481.1 bifunctional fucokinase/fucose-1-phosphate guanylyltransferase [Prevotellaceae bacterium]